MNNNHSKKRPQWHRPTATILCFLALLLIAPLQPHADTCTMPTPGIKWCLQFKMRNVPSRLLAVQVFCIAYNKENRQVGGGGNSYNSSFNSFTPSFSFSAVSIGKPRDSDAKGSSRDNVPDHWKCTASFFCKGNSIGQTCNKSLGVKETDSVRTGTF